jgi:hypothetical protein
VKDIKRPLQLHSCKQTHDPHLLPPVPFRALSPTLVYLSATVLGRIVTTINWAVIQQETRAAHQTFNVHVNSAFGHSTDSPTCTHHPLDYLGNTSLGSPGAYPVHSRQRPRGIVKRSSNSFHHTSNRGRSEREPGEVRTQFLRESPGRGTRPLRWLVTCRWRGSAAASECRWLSPYLPA